MAGQRIAFTGRHEMSVAGKSANGEIISGLYFSIPDFKHTIKIESLAVSMHSTSWNYDGHTLWEYMQYVLTIGIGRVTNGTHDIAADCCPVGSEIDIETIPSTRIKMYRNIEAIKDPRSYTYLDSLLLSGTMTLQKRYHYKTLRPDRAITIQSFSGDDEGSGLFFHVANQNYAYPLYFIVQGIIVL